MMRILLIDNHDSFTYNLAHGLAVAGAEVIVRRNDAITRDDVVQAHPDGIVLSPGPGAPSVARDVGVCADLLSEPLDVPMLGVCLGMQAMAHFTGGRVERAPQVVHGEARKVQLGDHPLFAGVQDAQVGRYHSLCVAQPVPDEWTPLGDCDGVLMAMAHKRRPWIGVQFHPESILTPQGPTMLRNFVEMCA